MLIFSTFGISSALIGMGVYFHFKGLEEKLCLNGLSGNGTTSISTLSTNGTGKTDVTRRYRGFSPYANSICISANFITAIFQNKPKIFG